MGKFDTQYNASWEDSFRWIKEVAGDKFSARCTICNSFFKINGSGIGQVKIHAASKKHTSAATILSGNSAQSTFTVNKETAVVKITMGKFILTTNEQIMKAEILWSLKCVSSGFSFSSNNGNNTLFATMFPDSKIAAEYKCSETKTKYVIEYGIAKYVSSEVKKDLCSTPFTFKFDETTTSQIKKQYDGYVQYFSKKFQKIINHYCGSLFLGHCTAVQLKDHFFEFQEKMEWDTKYLLHIGMDGPNVNLSFQSLLKEELKIKSKTILDLGTCTLHPVHNAFSKALKKIDFPFDEFPRDVWFFFKISPARREDYKLMSLITELNSDVLLRHVNSRWLSLKKVLTRILEQWNNLCEYFLKYLPKEKHFAKEIEQTERYKRIKGVLKDDNSKLHLNFAIHIAEIMERFLIPYQTSSPSIHTVFEAFGDLFFNLMNLFIKKENLLKTNLKTRKNAYDLGKLKISEDILKPLHDIDFGTKNKYIIAQIESNSKIDLIKIQFKSAYIELVSYLQKKLPHDSILLKDLQYINPKKKNDKNALPAIARIAHTFAVVLKNTKFSQLCPDQYTDLVKMQFKHFQTDQIDYQTISTIDDFWVSIGKLEDDHKRKKFFELSELVLAALSLSHGNVSPERGFSINKLLLQHRESLKESTIEAIRLIKDHLLHYGSVEDFPINRQLLECVCNSRKLYHDHLEEEKTKLQELEKKKDEDDQAKAILATKQKLDSKIADIDEKILTSNVKLQVAQSMITDGNKQLEEVLLVHAKNLNKNKLVEAQTKISIGLRKTAEINSEISALMKEKQKLSNPSENKKIKTSK